MKIYYESSDSLMHYGVPGMKWGVRKKYPTSNIRSEYDKARANRKSANRAYRKAYNKAESYSSRHFISQFKKGSNSYTEANKRWDNAAKAAKQSNKADQLYNKAKQNRKKEISKNYNRITNNSSILEQVVYNNATRKKAAKLMTDRNMSLQDAKKRANREAIANTAAILGAIGAYAVYKKVNG